MADRGSALIEALIATAIAAVVWAAAVRVIADLPAQAATWDESSAARQRVRVVEARLARIAAGAGPITVDVDGATVRVPSIWPRRLGLFRAGAPGEVSPHAVTFFSRAGAHRALVLASALAAGGSEVDALPDPGCGTAAHCGLRAGDVVLAVAGDGACGLFRVQSAAARLALDPIMPAGAPSFASGSVLVPIEIAAISFDPSEGVLRRYDGYRSDNVMVDGLRQVTIEMLPAALELSDGPFAGSDALAYDVDQLGLRALRLRLTLEATPRAAPAPGAVFVWSLRGWP